MMYRDALKQGVFFLLVLLLAACGSTGGTADGDDPTDGDIAGGSCVSVRDCAVGQSCLLVASEYICTFSCTENNDCQAAFPGGCCQRMGTGFFCAPMYACGEVPVDGDDAPADGDESDGDTPETCTPDEYRCTGDYRTVERCNANGTWSVYKTCGEDSCCYAGTCISTANGTAQCEGNSYCVPDTYKCRGMSEVQKCSADGSTWNWYRDCVAGDICVDGVCRGLTDGDTPDGDVPDGDQEIEEPEVCEVPCSLEEGCEGDVDYCFKKKSSDEEGCCTMFCDLPGASRCPRGFECRLGMCQPVAGYCISDADCRYQREFCYKIPGEPDGKCEEFCFNDGQWCSSNAECDTNRESPNYGKCVPTGCEVCNFDQQCVTKFGPGFYCNIPLGLAEGCCIEMCSDNNPCRGTLTCCSDGRCGVNCGLESCSKDCPAGYRCDPLYDACVLNCPPCGPNQFCDAASAPNCKDGPCTNPVACGIILKQCCFGYRCNALVYGVLGYCT